MLGFLNLSDGDGTFLAACVAFVGALLAIIIPIFRRAGDARDASAAVARETQRNGGTTMRDALDRIEARQIAKYDEMTEAFSRVDDRLIDLGKRVTRIERNTQQD